VPDGARDLAPRTRSLHSGQSVDPLFQGDRVARGPVGRPPQLVGVPGQQVHAGVLVETRRDVPDVPGGRDRPGERLAGAPAPRDGGRLRPGLADVGHGGEPPPGGEGEPGPAGGHVPPGDDPGDPVPFGRPLVQRLGGSLERLVPVGHHDERVAGMGSARDDEHAHETDLTHGPAAGPPARSGPASPPTQRGRAPTQPGHAPSGAPSGAAPMLSASLRRARAVPSFRAGPPPRGPTYVLRIPALARASASAARRGACCSAPASTPRTTAPPSTIRPAVTTHVRRAPA